MKINNQEALKIASIFFALSFLWIIFSDKLVLILVQDVEKITRLETYKGWFFTIGVSILIYVLVKREIGKWQKTVEYLETEESKYRTLFETAGDAIFIMEINDKGACITECNSRTFEIFRCKAQDIINKSPADFSPPLQPDGKTSVEKVKQVAHAAMSGETQYFEWSYLLLDNTLFDAEVTLNRINTNDKTFLQVIVRDVNKHKRSEESLLKEMDFFESLLQTTPAFFVAVNKEGKVIKANNSFLKALNYKLEEIIGKDFLTTIVPKREQEMVSKIFRERVQIEKTSLNENSLVTKSGTEILVEWHGSKVFNNKGKFDFFFGCGIDITERRRLEKRLLAEKEFIDTALDAQIDTFFLSDLTHGKALRWNRAFRELTGYTDKEIGDMSATEPYYSADDQERISTFKKKYLKKGFGTIELELICKDGRKIPTEYKVSIINDVRGVPKYLISVGRDITKRKKAEKTIKKNEETLKALLNATIESAFLCTIDGMILVANEIGAKRVKHRSDEIIGKNIFDFFPSNGSKSRKKIGAEIKKTKKAIRYEDEREGYCFDNSIYPVFDEDENVTAFAVFSKDITEQKRAQQALRKSEKKFRLLVENGPSVFLVTDKTDKTRYISPNITKIYGFSPQEIYEKGAEVWLGRIHEQDIDRVVSNFHLVFSENKRFDITYRIKNKSGEWIWLHDIGEKYIDEKGEELGYHVLKDITESKTNQQKVFYAMFNAEEKERSRIAKDLHDGVSPILSAIKLYTQSMRDAKSDKIRLELSEKISKTINDAIQSINEISNNISPHVLQDFGLKAAVETFAGKIANFKEISLSVDYQIKGRISENIETIIYRITTELINNTLKYANAKNITVRYSLEREILHMKYTDDGIGFNFEKALENKKGMGIFNIKNRISSLSGGVEINSQPNMGLVIEIRVPLNV